MPRLQDDEDLEVGGDGSVQPTPTGASQASGRSAARGRFQSGKSFDDMDDAAHHFSPDEEGQDPEPRRAHEESSSQGEEEEFLEHGEGDSDEDEDSEEEEDDYNFEEEEDDDEDKTSENSEAHETLTTVSNETAPSDATAELEETERQAALVIAGPPWSGLRGSCIKTLAACMLPFMLAVLLVYAFVKFWTYSFQCFFDIFNLALRIAWLAIRVALSPLYLLYRALMPAYMQRYLADLYKEHCSDYVAWVLKVMRLGESVITDLPNYTAACYLAAVETFVDPARARCSACLYRLFGRRAQEWILTPWHDQEINRVSKKRRAPLEMAQLSDPAAREQIKKLGPKKLRAKARAKKERARRLRQRKRMEALEITLMLPLNDKSRHHHHHKDVQKVQLEERPRSKMVTRVATVERGYAIAVGLVWCMSGAAILAITLDGVEGERCLICSERQDVGLRVCRHGVGRDCAFDLHMREIVAGIAVVTVGGLLTVYAIFLYKPRMKAAKAAQDEEDQKREAAERKRRQLVKDVDPELAAVQLLIETLDAPGFSRRWRRRYYRLHQAPCVSCLDTCAERLLRRFFRFEAEHNLRERSIALQKALFFLAIGWMQALHRFVCCVQPEDPEQATESRRVRRFTMRTASRMKKGPEGGCAVQARRCIRRLRESPLGPCIPSCLDRLPCLRVPEDAAEKVSVGVSGSRTGGRRPNLLEDVLQRFGLAPKEDAAGELDAGHRRLSFGSAGAEETQREFGLEEVDATFPEEEPRFHAESDEEAKDSETEEEDEELRGWNSEDEAAAEALEPEWREDLEEAQGEKSEEGSSVATDGRQSPPDSAGSEREERSARRDLPDTTETFETLATSRSSASFSRGVSQG